MSKTIISLGWGSSSDIRKVPRPGRDNLPKNKAAKIMAKLRISFLEKRLPGIFIDQYLTPVPCPSILYAYNLQPKSQS
jgi:hypothetical protein